MITCVATTCDDVSKANRARHVWPEKLLLNKSSLKQNTKGLNQTSKRDLSTNILKLIAIGIH